VSRRLFTSESVTEGHPDKIADQISDAVLDALLKEDIRSRVAVETLVTTGLVHVAGEVTTEAYADIPTIVRDKILEIGYDSSKKGFDGQSCGVSVSRRLAAVRKDGTIPYLRPDGKTQVTIEYDGDSPVRLDTVVVSSQHAGDIDLATLLQPDVEEFVIRPELEGLGIDTSDYRVLVNPTGRFEVGGPMGDAGLTGRKIIIDTYGGMARHGGGAFSGKDPSKVDRSAAYAMRWVAKHVVAAGLARRCEVQVAYAIGKAHPVGLFVETFGTGRIADADIQRAVTDVFDLRPAAIIRDLDLLRPIYSQTAAYGHFGRELPDFTWERTDRVDALRAASGA